MHAIVGIAPTAASRIPQVSHVVSSRPREWLGEKVVAKQTLRAVHLQWLELRFRI